MAALRKQGARANGKSFQEIVCITSNHFPTPFPEFDSDSY